MSKFKLTQTAAEVQNILNNSLQKPTGLAKTKLVGVGVNGQENIEIGDNLTLANGKLSSATGGSLPSTITFDGDGNRTVGKNLGVDGKLTLKSLVSESNPDGDITKELGGGGGTGGGSNKIYMHCIQLYGEGFGNVFTTFYTTNPQPFTMPLFQQFMKGKLFPCTGKISVDGVGKPRITSLQYSSLNNYVEVWYYDLDNPSGSRPVSTKKAKIEDKVSPL